MLYRTCQNWEAGEILYDGNSGLLWYETAAAARAVLSQSAEEMIRSVMGDFKLIRRNPDKLVFSSGYSWFAVLFAFPRKVDEPFVRAKVRFRRRLRRNPDDAVDLLRAAVVAYEGGHLDPQLSDTSPEIKPVNLVDELERLVDAGYP